ncbi:hypothetical protein CDG77_03130 [Nostoc sp. 'Peltigera membranacea cyanobiont' 213]|uniref:DUF416 family protein n=1 Tax=Nostoc sp. 'Peltigera membranacea cyanobiont' 213 TaxID=2014530 RepID=UPI000B953D13|nr:DUF416 family protein [Nostoc sp. 'Peltigera membranacea cyanobiont' 213]OYD99065.1 hypothetical protein CDG77_03130 [Nostoc sp. 'Peltigera membranacea cyanobiont' 213]
MNLKYGEFDILERELEALPPMHRVAFAAACCERLFPHYDIYLRAAREDDWDGEDLFRVALDEIWEFLAGKKVDVARFRQLYSDSDQSYPDYENVETPEAQRAAGAILNTLELCLDPSVQQTISVAKEIHETLFEYIDYLCQCEDEYSADISHEELVEIVSNHPFTVREMAKQSEDLQRLRETPTLTGEFLQWLRTSSKNGGKSLLDLS